MSLLTTLLIGALGFAAFVAVMWVRLKGSSIEELRAALGTAKDEILIAQTRSDRLEQALEIDRKSIVELQARLSTLENENAVLRSAIASGSALAPEFVSALKEHEERSLREIANRFASLEDVIRTAASR